jgi:hypothetical protein
LERRDPKIAAAALEPKLQQLLGGAAASVKVAAIKAAAALGITSGSATALELVRQRERTRERSCRSAQGACVG